MWHPQETRCIHKISMSHCPAKGVVSKLSTIGGGDSDETQELVYKSLLRFETPHTTFT